MYAWKCWRETRARFIVLLIASSAIAILLVLDPGLKERNGWWYFDRREYTFDPALVVRLVSSMILSGLWGIGLLSAVFLGVTSSGSEIEPGTIEYLWTRPRTRTSLTWTHWAVCAIEILLVSAAPLFLAAAVLGALTRDWNLWQLLRAPVVIALAGFPFLGLAILMTALRRSTSGGLIFTAGIIAGYSVLRQVAVGPFHLHIPPLFVSIIGWVISSGQAGHGLFPWTAAVRAVALSLIFVLLAQYVLKRAEI
jgi:ABC-type transport system involved in multi-copper enzyme maturation permease subunit